MALVEKPEGDPTPRKWVQLLDDIAPDPWGNTYQYAYPGDHNEDKKPDIWSMGPDGQDGTEDDIGNWKSDTEGMDSSEN